MSDAPAAENRRSRRKLRTIALTSAILVGGSTVVLLVMHVIGRSAVAAREAAIRAVGDPLTFEEIFARRPKIPEDENGALVLKALLPQLEAVDSAAEPTMDTLPLFGNASLPDVGESYERVVVETIRRTVADHHELLIALDVLRDRPCGSFDARIPKDPTEWLQPHLHLLRTAAKLQSLSGLDHALNGRTDDALARTMTILNCGATVEHEGVLISTLVKAACDGFAAELAERVLAIGVASPAVLRDLAVALAQHENSDSLVWAMWGERAIQHASYRSMLTGKAVPGAIVPSPSPFLRLSSGWLLINEAKSLSIMARLVDIARSPDNRLADIARVQSEVRALSTFYVFPRITIPALLHSFTLWNRRTAELRCARVAISAELHRIETGGWPASLEHLVPQYLDAVPLDPFDGRPLRYRLGDADIVVYSVGEDGEDEGGAVARTDEGRPSDVGFRLLVPARRVVLLVDSADRPATQSQPASQ